MPYYGIAGPKTFSDVLANLSSRSIENVVLARSDKARGIKSPCSRDQDFLVVMTTCLLVGLDLFYCRKGSMQPEKGIFANNGFRWYASACFHSASPGCVISVLSKANMSR